MSKTLTEFTACLECGFEVSIPSGATSVPCKKCQAPVLSTQTVRPGPFESTRTCICADPIPQASKPAWCLGCGGNIQLRSDSKKWIRYTEPGADMVKSPPHYTCMDPQPKEICVQLPFLEGSIVKYVCRFRHKDGLRDLQKAMEWLEILIAREYPS